MATIDDLPRKSVTEMSDEELIETFKIRRKARITPADKPTPKVRVAGERKRKAAAAEEKIAGKDANELYNMMSPEQKRHLANQLKGIK